MAIKHFDVHSIVEKYYTSWTSTCRPYAILPTFEKSGENRITFTINFVQEMSVINHYENDCATKCEARLLGIIWLFLYYERFHYFTYEWPESIVTKTPIFRCKSRYPAQTLILKIYIYFLLFVRLHLCERNAVQKRHVGLDQCWLTIEVGCRLSNNLFPTHHVLAK